jgi:hypothetical protein
MYNCWICNVECNIEPEPKAKLCAKCAKEKFELISAQYAMLPAKIVEMVNHAESCHGKTMFYSDEVSSTNKEKIGKAAVMGGYCPGFKALWKQFSVDPVYTPCTALKNFMGGTELVVAECEGFVHAVVLMAVYSIFPSDQIFNAVFHDLKIGDMSYIKPFFTVQAEPVEGNIILGDWVYIARTKGQSMEDFQDYAKKTGTGGAASGWNLICTSADVTKKYVGFGLSPKSGEVVENSLVEIMEILAKDIPRKAKNLPLEADFYLVFRRRFKTSGLTTLIKSCFPPFD